MSDSQDKCYNYFLNLLARREYSVMELKNKAKIKAYEQVDIDHALQKLQAQNYQSDARVVDNLILTYQGKKGIQWFQQKFLALGIAKEIYQSKLTKLEFEVSDSMFLKLISKYKIQSSQDLDHNLKSKIYNYLRYRGYTNIFATLEKLEQYVDNQNNKR